MLTVREQVLLMKQEELNNDAKFIREQLEKQDKARKKLELAIAVLLGLKDKETDKQLKSLLAALFAEFDLQFEDHLKETYIESYLKWSWLAQMAKEEESEVVLPKMSSLKWHNGNESYEDTLRAGCLYIATTLSKEFKRAKVLKQPNVNVARPFNGLKRRTKRLIDTESAWIEGQGARKAGKDAGAKSYIYLATMDSLVCDVCASLNGRIFDYKDAEVGVNYRPMHPYCRCECVPYFGNIDKPLVITTEYDEWVSKYVKDRR